MPLSHDDVREILRLIDESDAPELRVETSSFSLHVIRDGGAMVGEETAPVPAPVEQPSAARDVLLSVSAPMLGTFYRAQAPGASPFVDLGTRVAADTIVCLIEVMKMMNPVPAGVIGTIVEVCVENAELVEHGAVLFRVEPDG